ncbi:MAG: GntR family transcriptional regulator [Bacillota bacterium]|nr:GntR family transcriptional regulator [Bacillota bacterium]
MTQKKAFVEITEKIKRNMLDGKYELGMRLPSERALAEEFQTSRATIREALRALELADIIESRVGQGTFIKSIDFSDSDPLYEIANLTSPSEVFEARLAIEPYLAKLATRNATREDLYLFETCLQKAKLAIGNIKEFEKLDAEFHHLLATSAKSSLLESFVKIINKVRMEKLWGTLKVRSLNVERMENYYLQHIAIYEAIKERDIHKATEMTTLHLKTVRANMLEE